MPTPDASGHLQASMSKKMARKTWPLILLCIPIICLAVYYSPSLVSLGWHIMHGSSIHYRGLRVRVPFGWTADLTLSKDDFPENPQGVTLEKQAKTLSFQAPGPQMMYFNLLLPDPANTPARQADEWDNFFLQAHPASAFDIVRRHDLPGGLDCLQATPRGDSSTAALACISTSQGFVAQYSGAAANVPVFLQIAAALKSRP